MSTLNTTFPKRERIVSQKLVDLLFSGGESCSQAAFPLRLVWHLRERKEGDEPIQLLISVPKRRLRHAVSRNRVKRQLREAWRHLRQPVVDALPAEKSLLVAFVWISDQLFTTEEIYQRADHLIKRMASRL